MTTSGIDKELFGCNLYLVGTGLIIVFFCIEV